MKILMVDVETGEVLAEQPLAGSLWRLEADGCFAFAQDISFTAPKKAVVAFQYENCFGDRFPISATLDSEEVEETQEVLLGAARVNVYGRADSKIPPPNAIK
jgi:hypothetical protein